MRAFLRGPNKFFWDGDLYNLKTVFVAALKLFGVLPPFELQPNLS